MKQGIRILTLVLCLVILAGCLTGVSAAYEGHDATILFTHDLHSHFLPAADEDGGEYGGYARLMTAIRQQRSIDPNAILVDGGDFAMGSLFQTAYPTAALELRMMGAMGYDATTFGNHEYDYLSSGLCDMLYAALDSGDPVPAILEANFLPPEDAAEVWEAYDAYGVEPYMLMERGGVAYAIIGLSGYDCRDCAPSSGMVLEEPAAAAQRTVDEAVAAAKAQFGREPVVVCLSHSGTEDGMGEDYELAQAVTGIDLIISGHSHSTYEAPIVVGDTWIVSAGCYGKNLGVGTEGELISIYVTGSDLMNVLEVDASVYPLMHSAQLFLSGIEYQFNTNRMIFNKVDYAMLRRNDGTLEAIEPNKLYRVVTGMYAGQMLGNVEATSMGLLTITPREADGTPIDPARFVEYVVRDENGVPVKEWYAIASYLDRMDEEMDEQYAQPDGRKLIYASWNPVNLLRNANKFTWIMLTAILVMTLLLVGIAALVRKIFRKR